jgi:hypothetical protein
VQRLARLNDVETNKIGYRLEFYLVFARERAEVPLLLFLVRHAGEARQCLAEETGWLASHVRSKHETNKIPCQGECSTNRARACLYRAVRFRSMWLVVCVLDLLPYHLNTVLLCSSLSNYRWTTNGALPGCVREQLPEQVAAHTVWMWFIPGQFSVFPIFLHSTLIFVDTVATGKGFRL